MVIKLERQKDVLSHQYEESLKKLQMNIEALSGQIEVARSFAKEDEWSALRERVYALEIAGVPAMDAIYGKSITEARAIIENLEEGVRSESRPSEVDRDFLNSSLDDFEDLFEEK